MNMNFLEFTTSLNSRLSDLVQERTVRVSFSSSRGFTPRPLQSLAFIDFVNLPEGRHSEKRGGGAESENNRLRFTISGFDVDESTPVNKLKVELSTSVFPERLRSKTASPEKIAAYVAEHLNEVASAHEPNYTHG